MDVANTFKERLEYLIRTSTQTEPEVLAEVFARGLETLYWNRVTEAYIAGELGRKEAIEVLGMERVEELDYARRCIEEDILWGMKRD